MANYPVRKAEVNPKKFELFDDFIYQTFTAADTPWIDNQGSDAQTAAAITAAEGGTLTLTTGNNSGTYADDAVQLTCSIPVQADSGKLVFEARLKCTTNINTMSIFVGFTDVNTLEEPFSVSGTTITSTATDGVGFVYDTAMTTDEWWAVAVDGDTDDTDSGTTSVGPTAGVYQTLRLEVSNDGNRIDFYIDGDLKKTLANGGISPDVDLFGVVCVNATTTTSKAVELDYVYISHDRD